MIGHQLPAFRYRDQWYPYHWHDSLLDSRNLHYTVIHIRSNVRVDHIALVDIHQLEDILNYLIKDSRAKLLFSKNIVRRTGNYVRLIRSGDPFLCDQHIVHIHLYIDIP